MKIYISKYANEDIKQLQEQDKKKVERVLHSIKRAEMREHIIPDDDLNIDQKER